MHILLKETQPTIFNFKIESPQQARIRITAYDYNADKTKYTDRFVDLQANHARHFELKFPIVPKELLVRVFGVSGTSERSLKISSVSKEKLKQCDIWMYPDAKQFIDFAKEFSVQASYLEEGIYKSKNGRFTIVYEDVIKDKKTGKAMQTPARIGHVTGNIEVARSKFLDYTVPMRMIILLHEFSHKWMNQRNSGRPIEDETAADINALYMYLGLGFPHIDARLVFTHVFYGSKSEANTKRLNVIEKYITLWEEGKIVDMCK